MVAPRVLPGAAVLVASAISLLNSHIYWPVGVATMLGLALGLGLLAAATPASERAAPEWRGPADDTMIGA